MSVTTQQDYFSKVDAATRHAYDVLIRHNLRPQKYRVQICTQGISSPDAPHALTISTADGAVSVTDPSVPFSCIEDIDPFGSDAFGAIVATRMAELIRKLKHNGRPL
jgi:hypothetical protein